MKPITLHPYYLLRLCFLQGQKCKYEHNPKWSNLFMSRNYNYARTLVKCFWKENCCVKQLPSFAYSIVACQERSSDGLLWDLLKKEQPGAAQQWGSWGRLCWAVAQRCRPGAPVAPVEPHGRRFVLPLLFAVQSEGSWHCKTSVHKRQLRDINAKHKAYPIPAVMRRTFIWGLQI